MQDFYFFCVSIIISWHRSDNLKQTKFPAVSWNGQVYETKYSNLCIHSA
jgi:hypothetical protein